MTNGNDLRELMPPIKRCRDFHLYDLKGNRYLDLYLDDGRALMGHKPGKTMARIKNSLEKGLWAPYPTIYTHRLNKLLAQIFPGYRDFLLFSNPERAERVLGEELGALPRWRPLGEETPGESAPILIIKPPMPGIQTVIAALAEPEEIPLGDTLPGVILEGLIRNFHDYLDFRESLDRSIWSLFDNYADWDHRDGELRFTGDDGAYLTVFRRALENKIILPPSRETPARLPSQLSAYEVKCLNNALGGTP